MSRTPKSPEKLGGREWVAAAKRAAKQFIADDAMGMSQAVAYSWMLAFFPAVAFFLGLLGVLHLYDDVKSFLATVAPSGVIKFIDRGGMGKFVMIEPQASKAD